MSDRVSRNLMIFEAAIIVLPISALAILETGFFVNQSRRLLGFDFIDALSIVSVLSMAAICSGWRLFIAYLRGGVDTLRQQHLGWWALISIGVLILSATWISKVLPPSPEYSFWSDFRLNLEGFSCASPLLIPSVHLVFERFIRRTVPKGLAAIGA